MSKQMVSKSKALGKSTIIFVTVGTTLFQFNRLFKALDLTLIKLNIKATLIIQYGTSTFSFKKNVKAFDFLSPHELTEYIQKADKIITHGGIGTMHTISQYSNYMPLTIARLKKCNEHVNNHQKDFLLYAKKQFPQKYHHYFVIDTHLESQLETFLIEPQQENLLKKKLFLEKENISLANNLEDYIEKLV